MHRLYSILTQLGGLRHPKSCVLKSQSCFLLSSNLGLIVGHYFLLYVLCNFHTGLSFGISHSHFYPSHLRPASSVGMSIWFLWYGMKPFKLEFVKNILLFYSILFFSVINIDVNVSNRTLYRYI